MAVYLSDLKYNNFSFTCIILVLTYFMLKKFCRFKERATQMIKTGKTQL